MSTTTTQRVNFETAQRMMVNQADAFVVSILEHHNPLGCRFENGKSYFYDKTLDGYFDFLCRTWGKFPKGYIEMPYLMTIFYPDVKYSRCQQIVKTLTPLGVPEIVCFDSWSSDETKATMGNLMKALCLLTKASVYNEFMFDMAWNKLQYFIEARTSKKNGEQSKRKGPLHVIKTNEAEEVQVLQETEVQISPDREDPLVPKETTSDETK